MSRKNARADKRDSPRKDEAAYLEAVWAVNHAKSKCFRLDKDIFSGMQKFLTTSKKNNCEVRTMLKSLSEIYGDKQISKILNLIEKEGTFGSELKKKIEKRHSFWVSFDAVYVHATVWAMNEFGFNKWRATQYVTAIFGVDTKKNEFESACKRVSRAWKKWEEIAKEASIDPMDISSLEETVNLLARIGEIDWPKYSSETLID